MPYITPGGVIVVVASLIYSTALIYADWWERKEARRMEQRKAWLLMQIDLSK